MIGNAAHAVAGMALNSVPEVAGGKPAVGLTMFGVTTACITQIRHLIEKTANASSFMPRERAGNAWRS